MGILAAFVDLVEGIKSFRIPFFIISGLLMVGSIIALTRPTGKLSYFLPFKEEEQEGDEEVGKRVNIINNPNTPILPTFTNVPCFTPSSPPNSSDLLQTVNINILPPPSYAEASLENFKGTCNNGNR